MPEVLEDLKKVLEPIEPSKLKELKPSDYVIIFTPLVLLFKTWKEIGKGLVFSFITYKFLKEIEERFGEK